MEAETVEIEDENTTPKTSLPLNRIKKISKLVAPKCNFTVDAVQLLAVGAETYAQLLGKAAVKFAQLDNRKTIQYKDICRCIERDWHFSILEDAIEEWPESQGGALRRSTAVAVGQPRNPRAKIGTTARGGNADELDEHADSSTVAMANDDDIEVIADGIGENDAAEEAIDDLWDGDADEDIHQDYYDSIKTSVAETEEAGELSKIVGRQAAAQSLQCRVCDIEDF